MRVCAFFGHRDTTEGMENIHPRYAIAWRNKWMIERAEYVVVCVERPFGGAAKFAEMAIKKKKTVINIAP